MELGSQAHIILLLNKLVSKLRCAEEGYSGVYFVSFTHYFHQYIQDKHLQEDATISNFLSVMTLAYERKDTLFVADIVEYELIPYIINLSEEE